jgi:hypothetical protein
MHNVLTILPKLINIKDFVLRRGIMTPKYSIKMDQQHIINANVFVPNEDIKNIFYMELENGPLKSTIK